MRLTATVRVSMAAALALAAIRSARAADPPPTAADVQKLVADGDYTGALAASSKVLAAGGSATAPEKAPVYAAKGEAQLHLKEFPQSADAFDHAARLETDPAVLAVDVATALLVHRSHNGSYTPKQPGADGAKPAPVDVIDPVSRKAALGFLFADEFAAAKTKLKSAETATSVPQLLAAIDTVNKLRQLELAATATDEKTKPELTTIADHARGLLTTNLQTMELRVADLRTAANTEVSSNNTMRSMGGRTVTGGMGTTGMGGGMSTHKAGLSQQNKSELSNISATAEKIGQAADAFAKATATGGPASAAASSAATPPPADDGSGTPAASATAGGSTWDAVSAEAKRAQQLAQDVLTADYGTGHHSRTATGRP